jgi:IclR family acetate operon transcriptional repressor
MSVKQAAYVLDLIGYFAGHRQPATLAEISKHFGWPRSSTFNLLGTLAERGFLYEPKTRAGYYPSPLWFGLVQQIESAQPIPRWLHQLLQTLVQQTGETAVLAATSGTHAVFIDAVESPSAIRYTAHAGKIVPLHVTATGRALMSLMSPEEQAMILRKSRFERYTDTTLMSVEEVEQSIQRSSALGWFEGRAEFTPGLGGVAMPLHTAHRQLAVLVAGPMFRLQHRIDELVGVMRRTIAQHLAEQPLDSPTAA